MIGTLFLPICNKPHIFPEWENNLRNINLPKDNMKVVLSDSTGNNHIGKKAAKIVRSLGFAKCHVHSFKQDTKVPKIRKHWKHYWNMGYKVGETFENGIAHTEGSLLMILEDDLIIHPDTFNVLTDRFLANDSIGFIGACTYKKSVDDNMTEVIGNSNRRPISLYDDIPNMLECNWLPFGACVTYGNMARQFNFQSSVIEGYASPDVTFSIYIKNAFKKKIYLSTDIRAQHIFTKGKEKCIIGETKCYDRPSIQYPVNNFISIPKAKRKKGAPIFIVSYTGRGGSTLLQRILSSSPNVSIWGEPHGTLTAIFDYSMSMFEINRMEITTAGHDEYKKYGYKGWIANTPPKKLDLLKFTKEQMKNFFSTGGKKIWGIKAINWDSKFVTRMHSVFPEATFIFLHRNLKDVEESHSKKRDWWMPGTFRLWSNNHKQLTEMSKTIPENMHMIEIDYDTVKNDLPGMCDMMEKELLLKKGSLDREFLNEYISSFDDSEEMYNS